MSILPFAAFTLVAMVFGGFVVRAVAPRRARLQVRSLTGQNLAIILAAMQIAQLAFLTATVGAELPDLFTLPLILGGLGLAILANFSRVVVVLISALGMVAGVVQVAVQNGPEMAAALLMLTATVVLIVMLARGLSWGAGG